MVVTSEPGGAGPSSPLSVPVAATTVNSTNPNNFPVYVKASSSVSPATITNVKVNNGTVGSAAGTYLVPANGTISCTYSTGTIAYVTFSTGLAATSQYPFTDPVYQQYTCQQNLALPNTSLMPIPPWSWQA